MKSWIAGFSLGTKAVVFTGVLVALSTTSVILAAYWALSDQFASKARTDVDINLRTLALTYAETYRDAKATIENGAVARVEAPAMPAFSGHELVDRAVAAVGGTATIFIYDPTADQFVRRSTNVKKENGERAIGTSLAPDHPGQLLLRRGEAYKGPAVLFGRRFYTAYQPILDTRGRTIGILYVGMPLEHYDAMLVQAIGSIALVAGAGAVLIVIVTAVLVRRAVRPLASVTETLTRLAKGDLQAEVGHTGRADEIGAIARAMAVFRDTARRTSIHETEERRRLHAEGERAATIRDTAREFERKVAAALDATARTIRTLENDAATMQATAKTGQTSAATAADAADAASGSVQSAASVTEKMASSVGEIRRQVASSSQIASRAVAEIEDTNRRVQELSGAASKIGEVVTLIQAIAEQTNLLALNATIEAARAGEAGRGFAVVASEVKSLASQTAKATEEIAAQIERMQQATQSAVMAIAGISETIASIDKIAAGVAGAIEQQDSATKEIALAVARTTAETTKASRAIAEVDGVAGETTRTSVTVSRAAASMATELGRLGEDIKTFLTRVQAA